MEEIRRPRLERVMTVLSPLLILAAWEAASLLGIIDARFFSRPSEIAATGADMIADGTLPSALATSLLRIAAGFLLGVVPGVVIGALMGFSSLFRAAVNPLVAIIFPIPKIAILPLLLIIFGFGEGSKLALIALGSVFLTLLNTCAGVRNLPPIYRDVSASFGASRRQYILQVAIPGALPHILTGLKLSLQTSLLLIVAAEFVGADNGIGYLIWQSWEIFAIERMYVGLLVLSLLGYIFSTCLDRIEAALSPWRRS
jgi:NitT/TauT family transport system permease protein